MTVKKCCEKKNLKARIKQGDEVIVIAGKDKGKQGTVKRVSILGGAVKVLIDGVNLVKKHIKADPNTGVQGGITPKEAYLDISNVAIYNSSTGKADRVGYKVLEEGRKVRCFKSSGELIDADV